MLGIFLLLVFMLSLISAIIVITFIIIRKKYKTEIGIYILFFLVFYIIISGIIFPALYYDGDINYFSNARIKFGRYYIYRSEDNEITKFYFIYEDFSDIRGIDIRNCSIYVKDFNNKEEVEKIIKELEYIDENDLKEVDIYDYKNKEEFLKKMKKLIEKNNRRKLLKTNEYTKEYFSDDVIKKFENINKNSGNLSSYSAYITLKYEEKKQELKKLMEYGYKNDLDSDKFLQYLKEKKLLYNEEELIQIVYTDYVNFLTEKKRKE